MLTKKPNQQTASFGSAHKVQQQNVTTPQGGVPQQNARRLDKETETELKEAFELFDPNNANAIDARELKAIMLAFGIEVKKDDIRKIYYDLGKDVSEPVNFAEFVQIMTPRLGDKNSKEEIERIFQIFDEEKRGKISFQNLQNIAREVDDKLMPEDIQEMLEEADRDQDGYISFDEFFRVMKRRDNFDDIDSDEE